VVEESLPNSYENDLVEDMLSLIFSFSSKICGKKVLKTDVRKR
jgi:predicted site-specific integrase-resolvase